MSHAITRAPTTSNTPVNAAVIAIVVLCTPKIEKSIKKFYVLVVVIFGRLKTFKAPIAQLFTHARTRDIVQ
jgi:hypothetical protein